MKNREKEGGRGSCEQGLALWHYFSLFFYRQIRFFVYNFVGHKKKLENMNLYSMIL